MAKVPVYGAPQVSPTALGAPRTDVAGPSSNTLSPDFFGAVEGKQQAALGAVVGAGAVAASDLIVKMQLRENEDAEARALVAAKDEYLKVEQEWQEKRRGRFAMDLVNDAEKFWEETGRKYSETLTPVQQRGFAKKLAGVRQASVHSVSQFQARELAKSHDESLVADMKVSTSMAAQNPTEQNVGLARATIETNTRARAAQQGWSAERIKYETLQGTTLLHKNIIQGMVQSDAGGAAAYFEANKGEIDGTQHAEIGKFARDASSTALGQDVADAAWVKFGPQKDDAPVDYDKMDNALQDAFKGKPGGPQALAAARSHLKEKTAAFEKGTKERRDGDLAAVSTAMMEGKGAKEIMLMDQFLRLPGDVKLKITEAIDNRSYRAESREAARATRSAAETARAESNERRAEIRRQKGFDAEYLRMSDPKVLAGMSRNEILARHVDLGTTHTQTLLNRFDTLQGSQDKVIAATVDRDAFKAIVRENNMDPDITGNSEKAKEERARVGQLLNAVEQAVDAEQKRTGKQLGREEKDQIMRRTVSVKILHDKGWLHPERELPAAAITPKDLNDLVIPARERQEVKARLRRDNKPHADDDVARAWLAWKRASGGR